MLRDSRYMIRRLKADGFELVSVRGSHHMFRHEQSGRSFVVTHPRRDIPLGTARSIYAQAGWPKD